MAIAFCLLIGFALAGIAGVHFGGELGMVTGLLITWLGGNCLALLLAYLWYRLDPALPKSAAAAPLADLRHGEGVKTAEAGQAA